MIHKISTIEANGWISTLDAMIPKSNAYILIKGVAWARLKEGIKTEDHDHDTLLITFMKLQLFCDAYDDDYIGEEYSIEGSYIMNESYFCCSEIRPDLLVKYHWEPITKEAINQYFIKPVTFKVNDIDYWIPVPSEDPNEIKEVNK
jgi:hypothetical protein